MGRIRNRGVDDEEDGAVLQNSGDLSKNLLGMAQRLHAKEECSPVKAVAPEGKNGIRVQIGNDAMAQRVVPGQFVMPISHTCDEVRGILSRYDAQGTGQQLQHASVPFG
jgi:hypothetical protein